MASSVFYRWASRKDESRVTFDGTGISIFDLKREIILANNLSKANDFDLHIYDTTSKQGAHANYYSIHWWSFEDGFNHRIQGRLTSYSSFIVGDCQTPACCTTWKGQGINVCKWHRSSLTHIGSSRTRRWRSSDLA